MPLSIDSHWTQLAIYAVGAAVLLTLLFKIPRIGGVIRGLFSLALLAVVLAGLMQQAPYSPALAPLASRLGLDRQQVDGQEVRIRMSPDGHFWAQVQINGVPRRMLIDSGATITALSESTGRLAKVSPDPAVLPVMLRTANGVTPAKTVSIDALSVGAIQARGLKAVVAPGLGEVDVLGMNFLSQLASWRVEGRTLILVPPAPKGAEAPNRPS
jgi:aspartyl protease family protein